MPLFEEVVINPRFEILGDFIYMQQTTTITLDVITRFGILHA
jgi:hypothetical protein